MDESYRQSLAGRALADVLQALERDGNLTEQDGDALFTLFDAAVRDELVVTNEKKQPAEVAAPPPPPIAPSSPSAPSSQALLSAAFADTPPQPPLSAFTHDTLVLRARVESFNRYHDNWTVSAVLQDGDDNDDGIKCALTLDKTALPLPPPRSARMLIKLHSKSAAAMR